MAMINEGRINKKRVLDWYRAYFLYNKGVGYSVLKNANIIDGYSLDDWREIVSDFSYYHDNEPSLSGFWLGISQNITSTHHLGVYGISKDVWDKLDKIFSDIRASIVTLCACHTSDTDTLFECLDVNLNDMTPQDIFCLSCYADEIRYGTATDYKDRMQFQKDLFLGYPKDDHVRMCYIKRFEQTKQLINVMTLKDCYGADLIALSNILTKGTKVEISRFDHTKTLENRGN